METSPSDALEKFKIFVNGLADFPLKEWALLATSISFMKIPKGEHLFRAGEKSSVVGYVIYGLFQTVPKQQMMPPKMNKVLNSIFIILLW